MAVGGALFGVGEGGRMRLAQVFTPTYRVKSTQIWGSVVVKVSEPRWPELEPELQELVEVVVDGALAWRVELEHPTAGVVTEPAGQPYPERLWIREQSSGSGGYSTTFVFDLSLGNLRPLLTLENGSFEGSRWNQPDLSYRYWMTSGAESPVPYLRGRLEAERLVFESPGPDAAPTASRLDALVESVRKSEPSATASGTILSASLGGFLDLLYAGDAPRAWKFLERCHDAGLDRLLSSGSVSDLPRSREAFRAALLRKVSESPYYGELLRLNGGSIDPAER